MNAKPNKNVFAPPLNATDPKTQTLRSLHGSGVFFFAGPAGKELIVILPLYVYEKKKSWTLNPDTPPTETIYIDFPQGTRVIDVDGVHLVKMPPSTTHTHGVQLSAGAVYHIAKHNAI